MSSHEQPQSRGLVVKATHAEFHQETPDTISVKLKISIVDNSNSNNYDQEILLIVSVNEINDNNFIVPIENFGSREINRLDVLLSFELDLSDIDSNGLNSVSIRSQL